MKKFAYIVSVAAATFAVPSYAATEGYVEGRVGYAWAVGDTEAIGAAVGYEFDIDDNVFLGAEAVATTDASFTSPIVGFNTRVGLKATETDKVFATAGWAYDTFSEDTDFVIGSGYEHKFGNIGVNIQYQRYLALEVNQVFVGLGFKF
jgi:hypothetical protein